MHVAVHLKRPTREPVRAARRGFRSLSDLRLSCGTADARMARAQPSGNAHHPQMRFAACRPPVCRTGTGRRPWGDRQALTASYGSCGFKTRPRRLYRGFSWAGVRKRRNRHTQRCTARSCSALDPWCFGVTCCFLSSYHSVALPTPRTLTFTAAVLR